MRLKGPFSGYLHATHVLGAEGYLLTCAPVHYPSAHLLHLWTALLILKAYGAPICDRQP
jgi:hypothetical protein